MTVETKTVAGRRTLHFDSLQEVLAEAERLAKGRVRVLGNWSQGKIYQHLATTMDCSIDGWGFSAPWYVRLLAPLMKKRFLNGPMPAGFKMPSNMKQVLDPEGDVGIEQGLEALRRAVHRQETETRRCPSPA